MSTRKVTWVLIFIVLLLFSLPFTASASPGSLAGLGLTAGDSWMLDADEAYFYLNPAILQKLRPQVWGELTVPFVAGLLLNPMSNINLYAVTGFPITMNFAAVPVAGTPALGEELLRLGVSFPLGNLGLGVSTFAGYTSLKDTTPGATVDNHNAVVGLNAGVLIPLSQAMNVDVAGGVTYWNILRTTNGANDYLASTLDLSLIARLNWILAQNNRVHIFAALGTTDRSYALAAAAVTKDTTLDIFAGLSDEMNLAEAVMIFAGVNAAASLHATAADEIDSYSVAANAGAEIDITKEITGRLGITKTFYTVDYTQSTLVTTGTGGTTTLSAGFGIVLGELVFDAQTSMALLTNGPDFISGAGAPWSVVLSATYYLAKAK